MTPHQADMVNGSFEVLGAVFASVNIIKLWFDWDVRGVWWPATAFWTVWGMWNLYFYPKIGMPFSFFGGMTVVLINGAWVMLALYILAFDSYRSTIETYDKTEAVMKKHPPVEPATPWSHGD